MEFDYSKLRGRMRERGLTQEEVAIGSQMSPSTFSLKLNNQSNFSQDDICNIANILEIPHVEIGVYFFTLVV